MTLSGSKMAIAGLALASALALGGCYDDGYGYGGLSVGYGSAGYYGYDYPYYGGYGYPSYGWYDNFYYPGTGYYVFDRSGRRHRWTDSQRRYWQGRSADRGNRVNRAQRPPRGAATRPDWRQGADGTRPNRPPRANRPDRGSAEGRAGNRGVRQQRATPDRPRATPPRATAPRATTPRADRPGRSGQPNRGRRN